ncbi:MAG: DUF4280 domain-containing protein, partial [bacterium]|nr:DUF4280 domain-containing protein [bacterium]
GTGSNVEESFASNQNIDSSNLSSNLDSSSSVSPDGGNLSADNPVSEGVESLNGLNTSASSTGSSSVDKLSGSADSLGKSSESVLNQSSGTGSNVEESFASNQNIDSSNLSSNLDSSSSVSPDGGNLSVDNPVSEGAESLNVLNTSASSTGSSSVDKLSESVLNQSSRLSSVQEELDTYYKEVYDPSLIGKNDEEILTDFQSTQKDNIGDLQTKDIFGDEKLLAEKNTTKLSVLKGIKNYFVPDSNLTPLNSQLNKIDLLKWSSGGYLLLTPGENSAVLEGLKSESIASSDTGIAGIQKQPTLKSFLDSKKKDQVFEESGPSLEDIKEKWEKKQEKIKQNSTSTPLTRLKSNIEEFKGTKKHSKLFVELPDKVNKGISESLASSSALKRRKVIEEVKQISIECHNPENRYPLITSYNKMFYSWIEYVDSAGSYNYLPPISDNITEATKNLQGISQKLGDIYSVPLSYKGENISSGVSLLTESNFSPSATIETSTSSSFSYFSNSKSLINDSSEIPKKRMLDQLIELKTMTKGFEGNVDTIDGLMTENGTLEKTKEMKTGLNNGIQWAKSNSDQLSSGDYSFLENNDDYNNLKQTVGDIHSKYFESLAANSISPLSVSPLMIDSMNIPDMSGDNVLMKTHALTDNLNQSVGGISDSCLSCVDFQKDENMSKLYDIDTNLDALQSSVDDIKGNGQDTVDQDISDANDKLQEASDQFNDSLQASGVLGQVENIKGNIDQLNSLKDMSYLSDMDKSTLINSELSDLQTNMFALNSSVTDSSDQISGLLDSIAGILSGLCSFSTDLFCNFNPFSLLPDLSSFIPNINFQIVMLLKKLMDLIPTVSMPSFNLPGISMPNINLDIISKIKDIFNSITGSMLDGINALKDKIAGLFDFSLPSLNIKMDFLKDLFDKFKLDLNLCSNISAFVNKLYDKFAALYDAFKLKIKMPDIGNLLGKFDDMLASLMNFGSFPNFSLPELNLPSFNLPNISMPDFSLPNLSMPNLSLPDFSFPDFAFPFKIPSLSFMIPTIACLTSVIPQTASGQKVLGVASTAGMLKCSHGVAPIPYQTMPSGEFYAPGQNIGATLAQTLSPTFGGCNNSANPATAATQGVLPCPCIMGGQAHLPFTEGSSQVLVMNGISPALIEGDKAVCPIAAGGQIEIMSAGQFDTKLQKG